MMICLYRPVGSVKLKLARMIDQRFGTATRRHIDRRRQRCGMTASEGRGDRFVQGAKAPGGSLAVRAASAFGCVWLA